MAAGLARLEVKFQIDANGLLAVHARETTTGIEQKVTVVPSYGLDDATVERMLIEALDYGESDLARRRLAENRVEADRILLATRKALNTDANLLDMAEALRIEGAYALLEEAARGDQPSRIQAAIDALDIATKVFAARRMNLAMARAIGGQRVEAIERTVEHAKGIEFAHGPAPERVG